ncbi:MAG: ATP-binding cassette domain-containing protein [Ignavibacteriae bacterium]|nr:ATP-binding cassette domain-containing protein [Ignavibacteriota bacterium]
MIEFHNVRLTFSAQVVLERANLLISEGEFVYIIGETGVGKSSFLRLIYMDVLPSFGRVRVGGYDSSALRRQQIPFLRRSIGIVFQDYRLLEDRTVAENVAFALHVTGAKRQMIGPRVHKVLSEVGLSSKEHAMPSDLSGGEKQRVAIARALVNDPVILLADEPTGNLDPVASRDILAIFDRINKRGTACIIATHDYGLLVQRPGRVIKIQNRNFYDVV